MRSYRPFLIGFFLVVIASAPLAQTGVEIFRGERPRFLDIFTEVPTTVNLRAFETELERTSFLSATVRSWMQYLYFRVLRNPGDKILLGLDGWVFYKPDVRYLVEPATHTEPLEVIRAFRDQLERRGIRLVVVPVPGKPSVYPDRLSGRAGHGAAVSHTQQLIGSLRAAGVETVDLFDAFARWRREENAGGTPSLYLLRDTHWTGTTACRTAGLIAARIRELGWFTGGSTGYTVRDVSIRRRGDLVRMMDLPRLERFFPPEDVRCQQVVLSQTGELYKDDPRSPVLVLGDSFLRMYQTDDPGAAGVIAHLARELRCPMATIVNDGGASTLVRQQLSRTADLLGGKRVVIWEFVERDLRYGAEGWQHVALPGDTPRAALTSPGTPAGSSGASTPSAD